MFSDLDFDYLYKLYQTAPVQFEQLRRKEIDKFINSCPEKERKRLQGLQFQIDAERIIHKNSPMGACVAICKMMQESFETMRAHLNNVANIKDPLTDECKREDSLDNNASQLGKLLEFRRQ